MMLKNKKKKTKKLKLGRWILLFIFLFVWLRWRGQEMELNTKIEIAQGDNFGDFLSVLDSKDGLKMKIFVKLNNIDLDNISQWVYKFSGSYSQQDFVDVIGNWPQVDYVSYTILEWWSIYDVDYDLTKKWFIEKWEYLAMVDAMTSDQMKVNDLCLVYGFVPQEMKSLEGFLYPDTYRIDVSQDFLSQLITLQLNAFDKKVWKKYKAEISGFAKQLSDDWFDLKLSWYDVVKLASVVEKEERNVNNKPIVAGVFLNRLDLGMRLDADITLCYGMKEPYETCTPAVILKWIYDEKNIYNTRKKFGLVPQPISNPSAETFGAVLNYKKTNNLYYLHDNNGGIHYGETVSQHNINKNKYLK